MHHVFISYSSKELAQAQIVKNILEENQIIAWMAPGNIPAGSNYTQEIPTAIHQCQVFLLILSPNAQNSKWVFRELDAAVNEGKVIIPFMLEDFLLNDQFNFLLTGAQRYAAYQKNAEELHRLIHQIQSIINIEPASEITIPSQTTPATTVEPKPAVDLQRDCAANVARCPLCGCEQLSPYPASVQDLTLMDFLFCIIYASTPLLIGFVYIIFALILLASFRDRLPFQLSSEIMAIITIISIFLVLFFGIRKGIFDRRKIILEAKNLQGFRCKECRHSFVLPKS